MMNKDFEYDENFEEWFNSTILPETSADMALSVKATMYKAWEAGYDYGVDVGIELSTYTSY